MIKDRMIDAYNRSRKAMAFPTIQIIVSDDLWTLPTGVHKDVLMDGWLDSDDQPVDPSDFWTTEDIDVAIGEKEQMSIETEYDGIAITQRKNYFALYSPDIDEKINNAYGFLIDNRQYRLSRIDKIPSPMDPALIQITLRVWSEV